MAHPHAGPDHGHHSTDHFDAAAATWDDDPAKVQRAVDIAARITDELDLSDSWTVLDFGAGTGLLSVRLADAVAEIDMVDTSEGMLAVAEKRRTEHPNLRTFRRDLIADGAPRGHYDLITASLSLHHVSDTDAILDIFARLLTPGGFVAIAEIGPDPTGKFHADHPEFDGHHGFDPDELGRELARRGFTDIRVTPCGTLVKQVDEQTLETPLHLLTGQAPQA